MPKILTGEDPMARLCAQLLPNGKTCARFTLRGQQWCPAHRDPDRRNRTAHTRFLVENIPGMDAHSVTILLLQTLGDLRAKQSPPLHAEAVFQAAALRLEELQDPLAGGWERPDNSPGIG